MRESNRTGNRPAGPLSVALLIGLASLIGIAPAGLAATTAQGAASKSGVALAFTAMTTGPFRMVTSVKDDLESVMGDALAPGTLESGVGAARKGDWVVFDPEGGLGPIDVKQLIASGKFALGGPRKPVACLRRGTAKIFVDPTAAGAADLAARLLKGDRFATEGAVWELIGSDGRHLRLFGLGDDAAANAALQDAAGWVLSAVARAEARSGGMVVALGLAEGGFAVHDLAKRMVADRRALWVDGGNLVEDSNDARGRFTLERTLSSLASGSIDALVPYKNELRLSHADQVRLAATVPLVAANLSAPGDVPLAPFIMKHVAGVRVAIVGIADGDVLTRNNLVGRKTGWAMRPESEALASAIASATNQGADAIVILTNKPASALPALKKAAANTAAVLNFDFEPGPPNRTASVTSDHALPRPWLSESVSPFEIGKLDLAFRESSVAGLRRLERVSFNAVRPNERDLSDPGAAWKAVEAMTEFDSALSSELLPDSRSLTRQLPYYRSEEWTMLAAAAMRRAAVADVAVLSMRRGGRSIRGAVPRSVVEDWLPSGTTVAKANVRGAALKKWVASLGDNVGVAGYNPVTGLLGGRPLRDDEMYRIATTETFAFNEAFADTFAAGASTDFHLVGDALADGGDGVTIAELVLARLKAMKGREDDFTLAFRRDLEALLGDTGTSLEPKWTVSLNPVDISFNGSTPYNTTAFGGVANSRITAPATQTLKTKGTLAASYEGQALTWATTGTLKYDAATITQSTSQQYRQLTNELRIGSQVFANAAAFQAPVLNSKLVPFSELAYVTEVMPGINPKTGAENPRRQDTLGTLGVAYKGAGWIKELRAGVEARKNFALAGRAIEPGAQLAMALGQKAGIFDLSFDSLVDSFLPVAGDSPADLGLSAQFALAAKVPIASGFGLRIGVDGFVFRGKVPTTDTFGAVLTPSIGLSYGTTWKPLTGVIY